MSSVATIERPADMNIEVTPSAVKASGVNVSVTNGCIFMSFPDETMLNAFTSGLSQKGVLFTVTDKLTVRFFVRNNH
jgi:hypothetical protein